MPHWPWCWRISGCHRRRLLMKAQTAMACRYSITRKLCYRKDDRAMRPIHENSRDYLTTPTATIPSIFHGLLFRSTLWMFLQNVKSVGLPSVPEIIGGGTKIGQSLDMPTLSFLRFSLLSFTVFRTFYTHGHTTAFTWCDCRWPWRYFKVIRLFHVKFLINGVWYGKSYYRLLIGNHTLAFDWWHFWWPSMIFEGNFTLPRPISRKLYRIRPLKLK